jgi:tetratricopeptide (TPR) repeat protein
MEAVAWHQLGMVAEEAKDWDEAERCYRESLKLEEQMNNPKGVAQTCNQLARVAAGAGRLEDAERWYLRTIEHAEYLPDQGAKVYSNLANLYLTQNRLDEAEQYALKALAIKEQLDLSAKPWTTYNILARITARQGRAAEAAQWRRKGQDSYAAYAGSSQSVQPWQQNLDVIAAACEGHAEAQNAAQQIIAQYRESESWGALVQAFRRILDGERDLESLRGELDRTDFVVVRALLAQLAGEAHPQAAAPEAEGQGEGISLEQLVQLIIQARSPNAPAGLRDQLQGLTQQLANDANAPAEIRALGQALSALLSGAAPDLTGLPPQLADMLGNIMRST